MAHDPCPARECAYYYSAAGFSFAVPADQRCAFVDGRCVYDVSRGADESDEAAAFLFECFADLELTATCLHLVPPSPPPAAPRPFAPHPPQPPGGASPPPPPPAPRPPPVSPKVDLATIPTALSVAATVAALVAVAYGAVMLQRTVSTRRMRRVQQIEVDEGEVKVDDGP
jgi:hypothetical protein